MHGNLKNPSIKLRITSDHKGEKLMRPGMVTQAVSKICTIFYY